MRLFYGIQLSEEMQDIIFDVILQLKSYIPAGIKWVEKENLHITFQFIGDVKTSQLSDLEDSFLSSISTCKNQNFKFESVQLFPLKQPRLIWIALTSENKQFSKASKSLRNFLKQQGFNLENKDFIPHITLGRIKTNLIKPEIEYILQTDLIKQEFCVNEIALFESNLTKRGAIYRILQTYNLQ